MNDFTVTLRVRFFVSVLLALFYFTGTGHTQITITQSELLDIFTPGGLHYFTPGAGGMVNIGKTSGPNIYDFSFIDMQNLSISYNYSISSIPEFSGHFPADAITFGETPTTIEKNPVFYNSNDSIYVTGEASITPNYRFKHYRPYELLGKFPITYGAGFEQMVTIYDTTYSANWQVLSTNSSSSSEVTLVDGYGTLRLPIGDFECLRVKKDHVAYGDKEYIFMTKEGVFFLVGGVNRTDPDTGVVAGGYQLLLKESLLGVEDESIDPNNFNLLQNFPNPFNPSTKISWQSPVGSHQTLKIYDVLGNEITTLVDEYRTAGRYEVNFNAANLPSGVYFYRLQAGDYVQTSKMILLK
jgi:hypothetical protein